jgi:hypothetical protein
LELSFQVRGVLASRASPAGLNGARAAAAAVRFNPIQIPDDLFLKTC